MDYGITVVLGLAIILMVFWLVSPLIFRKKHWYIVKMADGEKVVRFRRRKEFWRTDILRFEDEDGNKYTSHWHWVKELQEISQDKVGMAREAIEQEKEAIKMAEAMPSDEALLTMSVKEELERIKKVLKAH